MKKALFLAFITIIFCLFSINANAVFRIHPKINDAFSVPVCVPLGDVLSSTVADLDATCSDSYSGSGQTLANIELTPADGKNQTDYDAFLGLDVSSSTDDPTFTGIAGDDAAFFDMDGGDFFTFKAIVSGSALADSHRTDVSGTWVAIAFKTPSIETSTHRIWGNTAGSIKGVGAFIDNTGGNIQATQGGDTGLASFPQGSALADTTETLIIISWDGTSTSNNTKMWINSATVDITSSVTFNTSTTTTTTNYHIGAIDNGSGPIQPLQDETRMYHFSAGNEFLDDTKAGLIFDHLEARHNRDYTP